MNALLRNVERTRLLEHEKRLAAAKHMAPASDIAPPKIHTASKALEDGRFAAATGDDLKMPAPMTMPMHTATACHTLSRRSGAADVLTAAAAVTAGS